MSFLTWGERKAMLFAAVKMKNGEQIWFAMICDSVTKNLRSP